MFRTRLKIILLILSSLSVFATDSGETPPACHASGKAANVARAVDHEIGLIGTRFIDLDGEIHHFNGEGVHGYSFVFLDTECPISNRYVPDLNILFERARNLGVPFYGIISTPEGGWDALRNYQRRFKLKLPILWDSNGTLAERLRPMTTPESFLVTRGDIIAYRGRIDNRFPDLGKIRRVATSRDLEQAMIAVAQNKMPNPRRTQAVGCAFEAWKSKSTRQVNYIQNVAPILDANCVTCHRDGEIAPFALETFEQSHLRAQMLAFVTERGIMPPWRPDPKFSHFRDERTLAPRQIETLRLWADAGAPLGPDEQQKPVPQFEVGEWRLGQPDIIAQLTEPFDVPAAGEDIYRYFVIPGAVVAEGNLVAIDFKPGDPGVVHHANIFIDYYGKARELDAKDPEPGFSVFGGENFMEYDGAGAIGGWAPGAEPYSLPEGHAIPIYPGDVVIEIHYHLNGRATQDQSRLGLYLAKSNIEKHVLGLFMGTQDVAIPANDGNYRRHFWMDVPAGMTLTDLTPHMHYLGKNVEVFATLPDGHNIPLIRIKEWDLRWQNIYVFREAIHLPAGSRIDAFYNFDNSAENPANPHYPPKPVDWGWQSDEEMCELYLTIVPDDSKSMQALLDASRQSWMRSAEPDQDADRGKGRP